MDFKLTRITMIRSNYKVRVDECGTKRWLDFNNNIGRTGLPAVISLDGSQSYWLDGKLHRKGGPAVEYVDGSRHWYLEGTEVYEDQHKEILRNG